MRNRGQVERGKNRSGIEAGEDEALHDARLLLKLRKVRRVQVDIRERDAIDVAAIDGRHVLDAADIVDRRPPVDEC